MVKVTRQCLQHHHHQSYEEDARLPDEDYQYQPQHQAAVYQRYQEAEDRVTAAHHHQVVCRAVAVAVVVVVVTPAVAAD